MAPLHNTLAAGRWFTFSLAEQLGNIGSEYERALRWRDQKQPDLLVGALNRMFELLDLTLADSRWQGARLKELARLREQVAQEFSGGDLTYQPDLRDYFLQYAILARKK